MSSLGQDKPKIGHGFIVPWIHGSIRVGDKGCSVRVEMGSWGVHSPAPRPGLPPLGPLLNPGSWIRDPESRIPNPGSWIQDPGSRISVYHVFVVSLCLPCIRCSVLLCSSFSVLLCSSLSFSVLCSRSQGTETLSQNDSLEPFS